MNGFGTSVARVTRNELADAVRSRRAAVLLMLFLGSAVLGCHAFLSVLQRVEAQLAETLGVQAISATGRMADTLWRSPPFRRMLISMTGERSIAEGLLQYPPIALFYGWMVFAYTPVLVLLLTTGRIAGEVSTGAVRFVLFRTSRLAWVLGKFFGQALLLVLALAFGVIGAWIVIRFRAPGAGSVAVLAPLAVFSGRAWLHALPYVGLALGVSQVTRSPHLASALGFLGWLAMGILGWAARAFTGAGWRRAWDLVPLLLPGRHALDLWRPGAPSFLSGLFFLASLSLVYLLAGYTVFNRRDL